MWVIVPVKAFENAKLRLAKILNGAQRARLSILMLEDTLETLSTSDVVQGMTVISSDQSVGPLALRYQAEFLPGDMDRGYSQDATRGISSVDQYGIATIAIIPADLPCLSHADLSHLDLNHQGGMTLCPAVIDGGTNAVLFSPPLPMPLMFGIDSLNKYQNEAKQKNVAIKIERLEGLARDIDRPDDLLWLKQQLSGARAWSYIRQLKIE